MSSTTQFYFVLFVIGTELQQISALKAKRSTLGEMLKTHFMIRKLSSVSQNQRLQILNLVEKNADSISINSFNKVSKIYDYFKVREATKIDIYLSRVGITGAESTSLLVAEDINNDIIGFVLFHHVINQPKDIAIICTIVSENFRQKGILKSMMTELQENYDSISLSCFSNMVNIYSKLGFKVSCQWETQIGMYYGYEDDGQIITIDEDYLNQLGPVINAFNAFKKNNTDWQQSMKKLKEDNYLEYIKASDFIKKHFT